MPGEQRRRRHREHRSPPPPRDQPRQCSEPQSVTWPVADPADLARRTACTRSSTTSPGLAGTADLLTKAATSPPATGRPLYAGLRALPLPAEPLARLWHAANLLREHRGDGHTAALVANRIGGTEAHVLAALSAGMPAEKFGRVSHLPHAQLAAVTCGMRGRGLIGPDGWLTADGRATRQRIEALTDELAAPAYDALDPGELEAGVRWGQAGSGRLTPAIASRCRAVPASGRRRRERPNSAR